MNTFCKNKLVGLKFLMGLLMVIWSGACFGQTKICSENLFTQNQSIDRVKDFVLKDLIKKNDSLKKLYEKSHDNIYKKEINKINTYIKILDNQFNFISSYSSKTLSKDYLESEIKRLKIQKDSLKNILHNEIRKEIDFFSDEISLLEDKNKRLQNNKDENYISKINILKYKIKNLKCRAIIIEIDLLITSQELSYLFNKTKE